MVGLLLGFGFFLMAAEHVNGNDRTGRNEENNAPIGVAVHEKQDCSEEQKNTDDKN